jgi:DegV family protein with EDD domain
MVKIISDSTCDLPKEILEKYDITLTPLYITCGNDDFRDGIDIKPTDVFRLVDDENKSCKTAAVNIYDYEEVFGKYSPLHSDVIHINISQGFSVCHQNANVAAEEFSNVHVVDSLSLSTGSGYLVHEAGIMAKEGKSAKEIIDYIKTAAPMMNTSFVIDRLDYLHKGGRCSLAKLIASRMLNIKPCIEVAEGSMRVGAKYKGKFEPSLEKYVSERLSNPENIDLKRVYITHPMCSPETVEQVRQCIKKYADFEEVIETRAGCTISNHCGPNTLGIIFKQKSEYK